MNKKIIAMLFLGIFMMAGIFAAGGIPTIEVNYNFADNYHLSGELYYPTNSILLQVNTPHEANCYYTTVKDAVPSNPFEETYGTTNKVIINNLNEGVHKYYIICGDNYSNVILEEVFKTVSPLNANIQISENPPLKAGFYDVDLTTSKLVLGTPKLEYSLDGNSYKEISLEGSGKNWKGHLIIPEDSGEKVGSFRFSAKDILGYESEELHGDKVFVVDTKKPKTIETINARGYESKIRLDWYTEDEVKEYNIYMSDTSGVDYTNFYTTTEDNYFVDNVGKGKTIYYRVAAVDEAGNIGDLSKEVYSTSLISNYTQNTGLNPKFVGKVDNLITEINLVSENIQQIKNSLSENQEKDLFDSLKLDKEIDSSLSELNSLERDVEKYKSQDLNEEELDKKINSASLKLDLIKKRTPESIIVVNKETNQRELTEQDLQKALLEYDESFMDTSTTKNVKEALSISQDKNLKIEDEFYSLEVTYLDGTKKQITLVKENLNSEIERDPTLNFVLVIPKDIAEKSSDIEIMNLNYQVIKEDPVISFGSDTKEITYYIEKEIDLKSLSQTILAPVKTIEKTNSITGGFIGSISTSGSLGIIVLAIVALSLGIYFLYLRKGKSPRNILIFMEKIKKVKELSEQGKRDEAIQLYSMVKEEYKKLSNKDKEFAFKELQKVGLK